MNRPFRWPKAPSPRHIQLSRPPRPRARRIQTACAPISRCAAVACRPLARPVMPSPIAQGSIGHRANHGHVVRQFFVRGARSEPTRQPKSPASSAQFLREWPAPLSATISGFTAISTMSAPRTAARLSVVTCTPRLLESSAARSGCFTVARAFFGSTDFFFQKRAAADSADLPRAQHRHALIGKMAVRVTAGSDGRHGATAFDFVLAFTLVLTFVFRLTIILTSSSRGMSPYTASIRAKAPDGPRLSARLKSCPPKKRFRRGESRGPPKNRFRRGV